MNKEEVIRQPGRWPDGCRLEFRIQLKARQLWRLLITPALQLQRPATPEGKLAS